MDVLSLPTLPIFRRNFSSFNSVIMSSAVSFGDADSVRRPLSPKALSGSSRPLSNSRHPQTSVATTGIRAELASRMTSGSPSEMLVSTTTSKMG